LLLYSLLIGIGLASFSVGADFVSGWYSADRQGFALGVYGIGNIGYPLAAFGAPAMASVCGFRWGFWIFGVLLAVWLVIFTIAARNAPHRGTAKCLAETIRPLGNSRSWVLSIYFALTFGGFVAMAIYLSDLLSETFHLTSADAGMRTAGFMALATLMWPVGGALADRVGGFAILKWTFPLLGVTALFLTWHIMAIFTIGALSVTTAIGLGCGAVFKLVPQFFPDSVGSVSGLVGAAGGLGGFLPPLVLGFAKQLTGTYVAGFILLCAFSFLCLILLLHRQGVQAVADAAG
jgi:NNP family nitrate/nitrite transporter-like MFS transporter